MMIDVDCYLCKSNEKRKLLQQEGHDPFLDLVNEAYHELSRSWYICTSCGFIYRSPVLSKQDVSLLYDRYERTIFQDKNPDDYFDKITGLPPEQSENQQKLTWLVETLTTQYSPAVVSDPNWSILDVGCGGGTLLWSLSKMVQSRELYGIELNPFYAALAKRRSGAQIVNSEFKPGIFNRKFDLVILAKVLEHVEDPGELIGKIAEDLKEDGLLFLEVPDIIDFKNLPPDNERFFIPHLYYFTKNTLNAILLPRNLKILMHRTFVSNRNRGYLQILARKLNLKSETAGADLPFENYSHILKMLTSSTVL